MTTPDFSEVPKGAVCFSMGLDQVMWRCFSSYCLKEFLSKKNDLCNKKATNLNFSTFGFLKSATRSFWKFFCLSI